MVSKECMHYYIACLLKQINLYFLQNSGAVLPLVTTTKWKSPESANHSHSHLGYTENFYIFNTAPFLIYPTTTVEPSFTRSVLCSQTDPQSIVILSASLFLYHSCTVIPQHSFVHVCQDYLFVHLAQQPFL